MCKRWIIQPIYELIEQATPIPKYHPISQLEFIYSVCSSTHWLDALAPSYWSQYDCARRLNVRTVSFSLSKNVK